MNRINKKGSLLRTSWAELYTLSLALIGFVMALSVRSVLLSYLVIIICGFLCGRLLFEQQKTHQFPSYMVVFGFFLGYVLGSYYTNRKLLLFVAIISVVVSYYAHNKDLV